MQVPQGRLVKLLLIGAASALMGATCTGTPPKPVALPSGKVYVPRSDERELLKRARAAQAKGNGQIERRALEALLSRYPGSGFATQARFRLGLLARKRGDHPGAVLHLRRALKGSLTPSDRVTCVTSLAYSLGKAGHPAKALQLLEGAHGSVPAGPRRMRVEEELASLGKRSGNHRAWIHWQSRILGRVGDPAKRRRIRTEMVRLLDHQLPMRDLRWLFEHRGERPTFPSGRVALRLARVMCHTGLRPSCLRVLDTIAGELPAGHRLLPGIKRMARDVRATLTANHRVIGVMLPLSGRHAYVGSVVKNSIMLAAAGITGVKLVFFDTRGSAERARKGVAQLVTKSRAVAILGPLFKSASWAAAGQAQLLQVPLFTLSIREGITTIGPYVFRNNLTLSRMGTAMARYAFKELSLRHFAVFYPNDRFGWIQVHAFWTEIERLGGKMVGAESYARDSTDFEAPAKRLVGRYYLEARPLWKKLSRGLRDVGSRWARQRLMKKLVKSLPPIVDFDAIFIPDDYRVASLIAPSLAQQDVEVKLHYPFWERQVVRIYKKRKRVLKFVQLLGTSGWNNSNIFKREPRHVVGSVFCVRFFAERKSALVGNFIKNYQKAYGRPPADIAAYAYDSARMLLHIAAGGKARTRQQFREALAGIRNFPGVTGTITVRPTGEADAPLVMLVATRHHTFEVKWQEPPIR